MSTRARSAGRPLEVTDADVVVAGAGPAGIATAVALARLRPDLAAAGRIVCFDKARFPREKPCGGGLTGHARAALAELGLSVRVPAVPCRSGRIVYGGEQRAVALELPVDVVRREELDADLVVQARCQGVVVHEGEGVQAHDVDLARGVVTVTTSHARRLRARVLVAADGAGSRIRRQLHADRGEGRTAHRRPLRLFKHEIPAPGPVGPEMIYDFSAMREGLRGYVWIFPVHGGRLNVGAMHTPSPGLDGVDVVRILGGALARHGLELPPRARGWPAWRYTAGAPLSGPHVLCVGDAAGIDALTGEGIAVGLEHGPLAAAAIGHALGAGDYAFARFGRAVRRATVGRELALDARLARMLYGRRGSRIWLSLVMFDRRMRELYAARVCGSQVLADRPGALLLALARHLVLAPFRLRRLVRSGAPGRDQSASCRSPDPDRGPGLA